MEVSTADLHNIIGGYVKENLAVWLTEIKVPANVKEPEFPYSERGVALLERMVRVEEETKHLREETNRLRQDMLDGFARMDKRFEEVDRRFDVVTKRIDRFMIWSFGVTITVAGFSIGLLKLIL